MRLTPFIEKPLILSAILRRTLHLLLIILIDVIASSCVVKDTGTGASNLVSSKGCPTTTTAATSSIPAQTSTSTESIADENGIKIHTPTVTPPLQTRTPTPTPTLIPGNAPALQPIDVYFIEHGDRHRPLVALTFDLCQMPSKPTGFDEGIFEVLTSTRTSATFFLGGDWMRTHVEQTRRLASIPYFELGNHSWSHPDFRELEEAEMSHEILRTQTMLYQLTGRQPRLFRFPAGTYNALAQSVVAWHGLRSIQWDVVTADPVWENTAEMINARVREQVQNGSIVIMHANGRGWHTAEALPEMIDYLEAEGYCLVTVSQMLGLEPLPDSCNW
jgi:peptidoglycan/xylan/chitin deacetylase (PgdA/CDA1 family)